MHKLNKEIELKARFAVIRNFRSDILGNERTVKVCLPESWPKKGPYPVIYMMDGQNVFSDGRSSFGMDWSADRTAAYLQKKGITGEFIIVAADSNSERMQEYAFTKDRDLKSQYFGLGGKGFETVEFFTKELVPFIDANFKTARGPEHRAIAGSSLGGLMAILIAAQRPDVFGKAAAMSPYLQWDKGIVFQFLRQAQLNRKLKIWADAGMLEGETAPDECLPSYPASLAKLYTVLEEAGLKPGQNFLFMFDQAGTHDENAWAGRLKYPLIYFFGKNRKLEPQESSMGLSSSEISETGVPKRILLAQRLVFKNGITADFLPQKTTIKGQGLAYAKGFLTPVKGLKAEEEITVLSTINRQRASARITVIKNEKMSSDVTILVRVPKGTRRVFVSGDRPQTGNWNAHKIRMEKTEDGFIFHSKMMRGGAALFKFTQGSWETVEKTENGQDIPNRTLRLNKPVIFETYVVKRWGKKK